MSTLSEQWREHRQQTHRNEDSEMLGDLLAAENDRLRKEMHDAFWAIAVNLAYCPEDLADAQDGIVRTGLIATDFAEAAGGWGENLPPFAELLDRAKDFNSRRFAAMQSEISRMREALECIERGDDSLDGMVAEIARAALNGEAGA